MKIEFIKEEKAGGIDTIYYTNVDGKYVSGSVDTDLEKALEHYDMIKNSTLKGSREVLKSEDILKGERITDLLT